MSNNPDLSEPLECFCEQNIDIIDSEDPIHNHLQNCRQYQQASPFFKKFNQLDLSQLDNAQQIIDHVTEFDQQKQSKNKSNRIIIEEQFNDIKINSNKFVNDGQLEQATVPIESDSEEIQFQGSNFQKNNQENDEVQILGSINKNGRGQKKLKITDQEYQTLNDKNTEQNGHSKSSKKSVEKENYRQNLSANNNGMKNNSIEDISEDNGEFIKCVCCNNKFIDFEEIWECLSRQMEKDYLLYNGEVKCKQCKQNFIDDDYKQVLGNEKYDELQQDLIEKQLNIIKCHKCKEKFEFQKGNLNENIKDKDGNDLSRIHEEDYANNRFICKNNACKTEQCRLCKAIPYHLASTCEEYKKHMDSKRCRYCDEEIDISKKQDLEQLNKTLSKNPPKRKKRNKKQQQEQEEEIKLRLPKILDMPHICYNYDCQLKAQNACKKKLDCGHECYGIKGEIKCLQCLDDECAKKNKDEQTGNDYCNICFVEGLSAAPTIRSACGHLFHYHCMKKRLEVKWITPRIVFNYCYCPLCNKWLDFPPESDLFQLLEESKEIKDKITDKGLKRLKFEEREKDKKLIDENSPFFNKKEEYAMAIYSYYQCYECKEPYFGGLKDCERQLDEGKKEFDPKDLICSNCCDIPIKDCKRHGKDYIDFKCRYCCSVALWFCLQEELFLKQLIIYNFYKQQNLEDQNFLFQIKFSGTTHFCDPCHNKAFEYQQGKKKLKQCAGPESCPLKVDHPENGQEFSLGCSLCRNIVQEGKDF
ncbi:hypothetical protein PPERSA_05086 [Pseudocohnilembus persalinus]|uniref:RING-type domain-containing protein n=1 Tax=Pseudocohnilembus persalinus TaxID=266149 RepID=A0A0V0QVS1_PSEPJ|nr:hypothetical protein PPERSA_05086 [Pseudocohnilembus persalinus]|eukprot:KRX06473.1 hypothetical protein PPERSA_05086 [Pseudocohnilembus persalinus]